MSSKLTKRRCVHPDCQCSCGFLKDAVESVCAQLPFVLSIYKYFVLTSFVPPVQLLARIERMERRLQLTRKDPPRDKRLFQPLEPWTPDKEDMWDLDMDESQQQPSPATPLPFSRGGKGQKR